MYRVGQGLLGKVRFVDGSFPEYNRPYLIVSVKDNEIGVLNISSAIDKGDKLLFSENRYINKHFPPFPRKSFVKLDSLVRISVDYANSMKIMADGALLDLAELNGILRDLKKIT